MKILITGGTGFIGTHLEKRLKQDHHQISLLTRNQPKSSNNWIRGNIQDLELNQDFDAIVHLVGIIRETPRQTFMNVHAQGTANLIREAKKNGNPHIIYISALGTRPNAKSRYHQSKYQAEEYIRQSDLPYHIIRPSLVFGPNDGFLSMLQGQLKLPLVPIIGSGTSLMQPIHVQDLVDGIAKILTDPPKKRLLDAAGPKRYTYKEILEALAKAANKSLTTFHLPVPLISGLTRAFQSFPQYPLTLDQLTMLLEDNIGENDLEATITLEEYLNI